MTPTVTQSDRQLAAEITVLAELREIILSGGMDEHVNVQTIARARVAGWNAAVEKCNEISFMEMMTYEADMEEGSLFAPYEYDVASDIYGRIRNLRIDQEGKDDE